MAASYAQQTMSSFTAKRSDCSSARTAAYSVILFVLGIAAAMSIIISSVISVRVFSVVLLSVIIIVLVILTKPQFDNPRG